ncbi:MAG: SUMF1/EgtB/PvdO family nonheme iron enzyme, partial [Candidatus Sumerlaeota bacterium]|nr:SUMF1/EgtB/PvdO family nonheme iron enzyme [Candidatus Sumerlaeota bacterium]
MHQAIHISVRASVRLAQVIFIRPIIPLLLVFLSSLPLTASAIQGDVDGSGVVNQIDVLIVKDHLTSVSLMTTAPLTRADANGDGKVDIADIEYIVNHFSPPKISTATVLLDLITTLSILEATTDTVTLVTSDSTTVNVGDILLGSYGGGLLRKVIAVDVQGTTIVAYTQQASLDQAIEQGDFGGVFVPVQSIGLNGPSSMKWVPATAESRLKAMSFSANLSGKVVYDDPNLTVSIVTGRITFTPELDVRGSIEYFSLKYFKAYLSGRMDMNCVMRAEVHNNFSLDMHKPKWTLPLFDLPISPAPVPLSIGPVPIVLDITGEVGPSLSFKFLGAMNAQGHINCSIQCGGGAEFRDGQWRTLSDASMSASGGIDEAGAEAFDVEVAYRVLVELEFFKVAGPYIEFGPYLDLVGEVLPSPVLTLYGGVSLDLGLDISILKWLSISYDIADWIIWETTIARIPPLESQSVTVSATPDTGQWRLLGPPGFEGNGATYTGDRAFVGAPTGPYVLTCLDSIAGYRPPAFQCKILPANAEISFNPVWQPKSAGTGVVAVHVTPAAAQWTLSGPGGFNGNGQTYVDDHIFANAPPGDYTWTGLALTGYNTPSSQNKTLVLDGNITFSCDWSVISGTITVDATPDTGRWTLAGPSGFAGSGQTYTGDQSSSNAPAGRYMLTCQNNIVGYDPPPLQIQIFAAGGSLSFSPNWIPKDIGDGASLPIAMLPVSAGTFVMGARDDEHDLGNGSPRHDVTLSAYQIGKYPVTSGQYSDVLNWALAQGYVKGNASGGAYPGGNDVYAAGQMLCTLCYYSYIQYSGGVFSAKTRTGAGSVQYSMATHPVTTVTWYGSVVFCNWLSEKEGLTPAYNTTTWELVDADSGTVGLQCTNGYRLPTEAEWERAAGWNGTMHWTYGFQSDSISSARCNYRDDYCVNPLGLNPDYGGTSPVGWFNGVHISPNGSVQTINSPSPVGAY